MAHVQTDTLAVGAVDDRVDVDQAVKLGPQLAEPEAFDYLTLIGDGYTQIRPYAPALLDALELKAAPAAQEVLDAVNVLKRMNAVGARKIPADAPTGFVRKRWESLVFADGGLARRSYELCALSELKNSLRSGDIWVEGSRQFKDFDAYLLPAEKFAALKQSDALPLTAATDCARYLDDRLALLERQLETVNRLAETQDLPDAVLTESGLKITPLTNAVPDEAAALIQLTSAMLPHVKITELLMEVDEWTRFTRHFTHIKSGQRAIDKPMLLTAILADAINLGLTKMAESCPGTSYAKLSWLQAWHIRDETYRAALADLVNAQFAQPFAKHWGTGRHPRRTGNVSKQGAARKPAATSIPSTAVSPACYSTHTSPISTHRSTPR